MATEDELLARPGCMRARWWFRCHGCRRVVEGADVTSTGRPAGRGELMFLRVRDGHRWWLCRACGEND